MKLKIKYIGFGIMGIFILIGFSTQLFSNFRELLIDNQYIIPNQSSIFTFQATVMNKGGGRDYWIYGEDKKNYYTTLKKDHIKHYTLISKEKSNSIPNFNKTNYKTWTSEIYCGDILRTYAKKPTDLEFIKCERPKGEYNQTIIKATYRINGKQSKEIEDFLIDNYGMSKLEWVCCGWEGKRPGRFDHSELKKIDKDCFLQVSMYGPGEVKDDNILNRTKFEKDRNKIDFYVIVALIIA